MLENKKECPYPHCINKIRMLNWKHPERKPWKDKKERENPNNINGIIKCDNPYCSMYFNYVEWKESNQYREKKLKYNTTIL